MSGSIDGPTDGFERTFWLLLGKKRLAGDTAREATSDEVKELKAEARQLKETLAEVLIENRLLKKSVLGDGEDAS
jgi:transposase